MRKLLCVGVFALLFISCDVKEKKGEVSQQITFEMKTFKQESGSGCIGDSIVCASYEVAYPVFSGLDSAVANKIHQQITAMVSMGNPEMEGKPMDSIAADFFAGFEQFGAEMEGEVMGWYYGATATVEVLTDSLISISVQDEYFTGGAHGGSGVYYFNINPKTGAEFTLDNFFKEGYKQPLTSLAEGLFRKERELADTASFSENGFEFPEDQFQLNQNYGFTKEGIVFYYNNYEVGPYVLGPTQVMVSYTILQDWIR